MTGNKCNAGSPLSQSKNELDQQLAELDNQLYQLHSLHRFYHSAIQTYISNSEQDHSQQWQFGLFLFGQWIEDRSNHLLQQVEKIKRIN